MKAPGNDLSPIASRLPDRLIVDAPLGAGRNRVAEIIKRALFGGDIEGWRQDPAARKKILAATIRREIAALANELRKRGVRNPITRAEEEVAKRWQHASGAALNRWLRRNR